jgi:hypothetical protein
LEASLGNTARPCLKKYIKQQQQNSMRLKVLGAAMSCSVQEERFLLTCHWGGLTRQLPEVNGQESPSPKGHPVQNCVWPTDSYKCHSWKKNKIQLWSNFRNPGSRHR